MNELPVIPPVDTALIESELTDDRYLRDSNKGGNRLYVVDAHCAPNVMREIGRLRELTFRSAGGGTGKDCDIDSFDTMETPCRQLIVWDPQLKIILGGYRFILGRDIKIDEAGVPVLATSHMFRFSQRFIEDYLPYTIELGRSFVRTEFQSSRYGAKAIFALDNLWDGLGAITVLEPDMKYLFGKMTMYSDYPRQCRDSILHFLNCHFPDNDHLVEPIVPLPLPAETDSVAYTGSFKEDYRILNHAVRSHGLNIPPLVNAYMNLSPTMKTFGTAVNDQFGNVEETGIFIAIDDIFEEKKRRHIESYQPHEP